MTWGEGLVTLLGAVILVVGTWITARFSRKTGEEANENAATQSRSADWAAFMAEQREWTEDRLAERDQRINGLATELAEVRSELGIVRSELETFKTKYQIAVLYIQRIFRQLQQHVDPADIEPPPAEIAPDL